MARYGFFTLIISFNWKIFTSLFLISSRIYPYLYAVHDWIVSCDYFAAIRLKIKNCFPFMIVDISKVRVFWFEKFKHAYFLPVSICYSKSLNMSKKSYTVFSLSSYSAFRLRILSLLILHLIKMYSTVYKKKRSSFEVKRTLIRLPWQPCGSRQENVTAWDWLAELILTLMSRSFSYKT